MEKKNQIISATSTYLAPLVENRLQTVGMTGYNHPVDNKTSLNTKLSKQIGTIRWDTTPGTTRVFQQTIWPRIEYIEGKTHRVTPVKNQNKIVQRID